LFLFSWHGRLIDEYFLPKNQITESFSLIKWFSVVSEAQDTYNMMHRYYSGAGKAEEGRKDQNRECHKLMDLRGLVLRAEVGGRKSEGGSRMSDVGGRRWEAN